MTAIPPPLEGEIQLPPYAWIPNVDRISETAATLLSVVTQTFDQLGVEGFERRAFVHGDPPAWKPYDPAHPGQVLVFHRSTFSGRAGTEQFQFPDGAIGKVGQGVLRYGVDVVVSWPVPQGGNRPQLTPDDVLMAYTATIGRAGHVAWSALRALAMGGIRTNPTVAPIAADNILVGPLTPLGPHANQAGYRIDVQVQL